MTHTLSVTTITPRKVSLTKLELRKVEHSVQLLKVMEVEEIKEELMVTMDEAVVGCRLDLVIMIIII